MAQDTEKLVFFETPTVWYASNWFTNVPVILQYDETPLIEVVGGVQAAFTAQFSIYNKDGVYLARVKGSQMYLTEDGKKADLKLHHPDLCTVCELDGKTLFEVRRTAAAALKAEAELFTPDGRFLKGDDGAPTALVLTSGDTLKLGSFVFDNCSFNGLRIAVLIRSDGTTAMCIP